MPHQPDAAALEAAETRPRRHLAAVPVPVEADGSSASREAVRAQHPAGRLARRPHLRIVRDLADESGSLVAEYGLLMVLGATITMLATKWATGGAIWSLFGAVLSRARALVGA